MEKLIPIFCISAFIGVPIFVWTLNWYWHKEKEDMRTMDVHVLAAEAGWGFRERDDKLTQLLAENDLIFARNGEVENICFKNGLNGSIYIFDYSFRRSGLDVQEPPPVLNLIVTLVDLPEGKLPKLKICDKDMLIWFPNGGKTSKHANLISEWSQENYLSYLFDPISEDIFKLLPSYQKMQRLLSHRFFAGLCANKNYAVLYHFGKLPDYEEAFVEAIKWPDTIFSVFTHHEDQESIVEELKRSEKDEQEDSFDG